MFGRSLELAFLGIWLAACSGERGFSDEDVNSTGSLTVSSGDKGRPRDSDGTENNDPSSSSAPAQQQPRTEEAHGKEEAADDEDSSEEKVAVSAAASVDHIPENPEPPPPSVDEELFPGFKKQIVKTEGAEILSLHGGNGPPLLLLHGHPQTHVAWHKIANDLAKEFTVVLTDLRGYGDSSKPEGGHRHINYSPRSMGEDQFTVMRYLGFDRFAVVGHDRGGRVAHRMALDYPDRVTKIAVLDIAPTLTMYTKTNREFATRYMWWFFQIRPEPLPERLIGKDPEFYLREHLKTQNKTPGAISDVAMSEYIRCYCCRTTIHAACEDYRAAAGIGSERDAEDDKAGNRVKSPLLALWGAKGTVGELYDVLATWQEKAESVSGKALNCGHLLPEECPTETLDELLQFLRF